MGGALARIGDTIRAAAGQVAEADHLAQQASYAGLFGIPYDRADAAARGAVEWFEELTAAHAKGLDRSLAAAQAERDSLAVEDVDATHAMLLEEPEEIAARVLAFTRTL
ncbi:hypothetical protein [Streptomyces sp. NPDC091212]|uniref:hypothetical protein n=1 Tax=Streptomyces sp. NPDC091212 TaxID=3155191 RepID=UPI003428D4EB